MSTAEFRVVCRFHGSGVKNDKGEFVCCAQEEWAAIPQTPPPPAPHPPPPGLRAQVAAALGRERSGREEPATEGAEDG